MNKKFVVHARVLKAMSDENRLRILDLLREREYNASELLDGNGLWTVHTVTPHENFTAGRSSKGTKEWKMDIL